MQNNRFILILISIVVALFNSNFIYAESPTEMWEIALANTKIAAKDGNLVNFEQGVKDLEKAYNKGAKNAINCYTIGSFYYYRYYLNGHFIALDQEKGMKWFEKGSKQGEINSALALFSKYRPEQAPYSILAPKRMWKEYLKARDKSWKYAGIALKAQVPEDFNNFLTLGDAAWFTDNDNLAHKYFAKAADNEESGAIALVIRDERALDYLTTGKAMYEAATQMWCRDKNKDVYGHEDRENGLKYFEKAAKNNYLPAIEMMGDVYLKGLTVKSDTLKAVSWYKRAAKSNSIKAQKILGRLYLKGTGVHQDLSQAFQYFTDSQDNLMLGYCHLYGLGTEKNSKEARKCFQQFWNLTDGQMGTTPSIIGNVVHDPDYLIGLTYYEESRPEAVSFFEASLKKDTFGYVQRADLLHRLSECYSKGMCGVKVDSLYSEVLRQQAIQLSTLELNNNTIPYNI